MQLLNQLVKKYLLFSSFLVLVSIPVSYFFLNRLIFNEAREVLSAKQDNLRVRFITLKDSDSLLRFIWDRDDLTLVPMPEGGPAMDSIFRTTEYDSISKEHIPYLAHAYTTRLLDRPYLITQRESMIQDRALIILILKEQAALLILLLCVLLFIHFRFSQIAWKPFYQTLQQLQQYELGKDSSLHLPKSKIKEFNELNQTIQSLAEKSHKTYQAQKEFTENAAHEIQTPLAIFQSKLDVLMQHEWLNHQGAELIESLTDVSHRLSRIAKGLLLLTKIENNQFFAREPLPISEQLQSLVQQFNGQFRNNSIACSTEILPGLMISANSNLTDVLLSNLLSNAVRHNTPNGKIHIQLQQEHLTISNTGDPKTLDVDKMYERFAKRGNHPNSIGLGLAIVKKICDVCEYGIGYRFDETLSLHVFRISFFKK